MVAKNKYIAYGLQIVKDNDSRNFLNAVLVQIKKNLPSYDPNRVYFILGYIKEYMFERYPTLVFKVADDHCSPHGFMIYVESTLYQVGESDDAIYLPPTTQEQLELEACKKEFSINGEISAIRWSETRI